MINENYLYNGNVKVICKTSSGFVYEVKRKNNGTDRLFRGLCFSLLGYPFDELKPQYITLATVSDNSFTSLLNGPSSVSGTYDVDTNTVKFVGTISSYQVADNQNKDHTYICLLSGASGTINGNVLAYIEAPQGINNIGAGTVLTIEWVMGFDNK